MSVKGQPFSSRTKPLHRVVLPESPDEVLHQSCHHSVLRLSSLYDSIFVLHAPTRLKLSLPCKFAMNPSYISYASHQVSRVHSFCYCTEGRGRYVIWHEWRKRRLITCIANSQQQDLVLGALASDWTGLLMILERLTPV